jgi:hypothetical protein
VTKNSTAHNSENTEKKDKLQVVRIVNAAKDYEGKNISTAEIKQKPENKKKSLWENLKE